MAGSFPRCPVCDQPFDPQKSPAKPFCSQRCKQIDLGRWLGERYGVPYERPYDSEQPESFDEEN
jgi:endogenous inhibitor of DNA gyrase (YacG/DUF329 family)